VVSVLDIEIVGEVVLRRHGLRDVFANVDGGSGARHCVYVVGDVLLNEEDIER
jgi:hypothetical protein